MLRLADGGSVFAALQRFMRPVPLRSFVSSHACSVILSALGFFVRDSVFFLYLVPSVLPFTLLGVHASGSTQIATTY